MHGLKKNFMKFFFRHVFTSTHPHQELESDTFKCSLRIDVRKLSHITHDKEAEEINKGRSFCFQPKKKMGKRYFDESGERLRNGDPLGESFVDSFLQPGMQNFKLEPSKQKYHYIEYPECVMPEGYYSWWGVHISPELSHGALSNAREWKKCPPYLQEPPASHYGNKEFSGDFDQLLYTYQQMHKAPKKRSHDDTNEEVVKNPDVYLLLGGTLRYRYEICCVVIVCTEQHRENAALKDYQPVPQMQFDANFKHPILDLRGLTDRSGKVCEFTEPPRFYPRFINKQPSWANLAFAFYFDTHDTFFELHDLECSEVKHNRVLCTSTRPREGEYGETWYCPNELRID